MFSKLGHNTSGAPPLPSTLAFRLTAAYSLAGLALVLLGTASLYFVLRAELDRSTDLFLADKLHVLRTMLRDRPTMRMRCAKKLSWSRRPVDTSSFTFVFWMSAARPS